MKNYKIAIVGLGSIGKRHLINLGKIARENQMSFSIDLIRSQRRYDDIESDYLRLVNNIYFYDDNFADDYYDVIFITNPTFLHYDTIKKFSSKTKHMFIEKPVFHDCGLSLDELNLKENSVYYVACPLRYSSIIEYLKNSIVGREKIYSVRIICSSYLPDWRPNVDYRKIYSSYRDKGGGVVLDLIHEWDYACYLFGYPKHVSCMRGKYSHLEIDSDDLAVYLAEYDNMLLEIHLDYFGRKALRQIDVLTEEETITADIINGKIDFLKEGKTISFSETKDDFYLKELKYFFDVLEGKKENMNSIYNAVKVLKIALEGNAK